MDDEFYGFIILGAIDHLMWVHLIGSEGRQRLWHIMLTSIYDLNTSHLTRLPNVAVSAQYQALPNAA